MNPMLLKLLMARAGGGGAGRGLINAAGDQSGSGLLGAPGASQFGQDRAAQQTPMMGYLQSQGSKMAGGYDPSTGVDWQTGRQNYGPGGPGPGATNQLSGMQALGK